MQILHELNNLARRACGAKDLHVNCRAFRHGAKLRILAISDAIWAREPDSKSQGWHFILIAEDVDSSAGRGIACQVLSWRSWTLKRAAIGTLSAESQAVECTNAAIQAQGFICWAWGIARD